MTASHRDTSSDDAAHRPAVSQQDALNLIRGWRWFSYLEPETQDWLASRAVAKGVEKNKMIYMSGDPAQHIYGVVSGACRIFITSRRGDDITLEEVVKGGWFPHVVPAEKPVYFGNCICQSDATILSISRATITELEKRSGAYYRGLYHEFMDRASVIMGRIELLSLHNLNVRLAVYLLRIAKLRGQPQEGSKALWVDEPNSQSEFGARVGGTRQRVNGILKTWAAKKYIELHKDGILLLDMKALNAEARKSGFDVDQYLSSWHGGWQGKS